MRPEGSQECTAQSQAFAVCRARGAWSTEASGDSTLLCEREESCVLGGGEGSGLPEEEVCFWMCVAKAEECGGGFYCCCYFNLFDASGRDAAGRGWGSPRDWRTCHRKILNHLCRGPFAVEGDCPKVLGLGQGR